MTRMDVVAVLVSLERDGETVAVVRGRDGRESLSGSIDRVEGPRLGRNRPARLGLTGDRAAVGGRLPSGAVSAEVVDDAGKRHVAVVANGTYLAVLDEASHGQGYPVCCRDEDGVPVAPTLPCDWTRIAVSDTEEPCPACGAVAWEVVRPGDVAHGARGSADDGMEPTPMVLCRTCGHEESVGAWAPMTPITFQRDGSGDQGAAERAIRTRVRARRARNRELLAEVGFPIYAAEGYPAMLAGHAGGSSEGDPRVRIEQVTVAQGASTPGGAALRVETALNGDCKLSERARATNELASRLRIETPPWRERSEASRALALHAALRERRRLARRAQEHEQLLRVEGRPQPFTFLRTGERWVAVRRMQQVTITVSGNGVDPDSVALRPLGDASGELLDARG